MTTVYFSRADFRCAMRSPDGSPRVHAICRRLTAAPQTSKLYAAIYWAGCFLLRAHTPTTKGKSIKLSVERLRRYMNLFAYEFDRPPEHYGRGVRRKMSRSARAAWRWAIQRIRAIVGDAMRLPTSIAW